MRGLTFLASAAIVAGASVGAALAFQHDSSPTAEATITTMLGEEPVGLSARMQDAADQGPPSIACEPGDGTSLVCVELRDEDALRALRRGETVYGRNVFGFPDGAKTDPPPKFEPTSLVCGELDGGSMTCLPIAAVVPTVRAGQEIFVYYMRQDVTFLDDGTPVLHVGEPTVPAQVVTD